MRLFCLLLILCPILAWSQPSSEPAKDSTTSSSATEKTHCFTDTEWAALEDEVWAEEQQAIKEAVEAAIKPHIEYEAKISAELRAWQVASCVLGALVAVLAVGLIAR